jgi:hypothetical protein
MVEETSRELTLVSQTESGLKTRSMSRLIPTLFPFEFNSFPVLCSSQFTVFTCIKHTSPVMTLQNHFFSPTPSKWRTPIGLEIVRSKTVGNFRYLVRVLYRNSLEKWLIPQPWRFSHTLPVFSANCNKSTVDHTEMHWRNGLYHNHDGSHTHPPGDNWHVVNENRKRILYDCEEWPKQNNERMTLYFPTHWLI